MTDARAEGDAAIYDISRAVTAQTPPWPGDLPYALTWNWRQDAGDSVNVASIAMSVHLGTHIDAPFHFDKTGARAGELDLTPFWGPAVVVDLTATANVNDAIGWEPFADLDLSRTPRVLLKTGAWEDVRVFPSAVPVLATETVVRLAHAGVILLGIDLPSVDHLESKELPVHRALGANDIRILESIDLSAVPAGEYELSAMPLRLMDADGAPVRAALRR